MTTLVKPSYGSATAITCTTTSLSSDTNLLAGRASTAINNTSDLGITAILGGTIATTSTPTANTQIEVWLYGSWDNATTYTDAITGTDADITIVSGRKSSLSLATVISQPDTTARTYTIGPIDVAAAFGGTMPDHWGVYVVHNTTQTLGATTLKYTPIQYQNV